MKTRSQARKEKNFLREIFEKQPQSEEILVKTSSVENPAKKPKKNQPAQVERLEPIDYFLMNEGENSEKEIIDLSYQIEVEAEKSDDEQERIKFDLAIEKMSETRKSAELYAINFDNNVVKAIDALNAKLDESTNIALQKCSAVTFFKANSPETMSRKELDNSFANLDNARILLKGKKI
ncbi:MAG: hypothetical protein JO149_00620 [Gammaproteobacteria bacterium]|nr:hypothetical protein [Gammaproteobacteria bacterium]